MLGRSQTWISKFDPAHPDYWDFARRVFQDKPDSKYNQIQDTIVKNINSAYEGNQIARLMQSALVGP